jgi:predicted acyltransferase
MTINLFSFFILTRKFKLTMEKSDMSSNKPKRLMSLDALRGFDMFWIIGGASIFTALAKAVGGPLNAILPQFEHVRWEGLHFFDLIWPLFMFIIGVSIPLSLEKRMADGASKRSLYLHAVRRSIILFILGMILQGGLLEWDLSKLHPCYSVLHGIAAGYLIAVIVTIELKPKYQAAVTAVFLLVYWAVLMLIPVPDIGAGVLTPEGNIATWFDQLVLGRFHHGENTWFLSYPAFAASVLLGVIAGHIIRLPVRETKQVIWLAGTGVGCIVLGLLWSILFPVIKLLWTSTFVLIGGGFGFLMLSIFYWIIEVKQWRRWAFFFRVIGMNSIVVYFFAMLINFRQIGDIFVGGLLPRIGRWDDFVSETAALAIIWLILYWMYRKKTFVRL